MAEKGQKHVGKITAATKDQITVECCFNAAGDFCPPYIVFAGKRRSAYIHYEQFLEAFYGKSTNGWMEGLCFYGFIVKLYHWIVTNKPEIKFPIIVLVDGHKSHILLETAIFCRDHGIILFIMLPGATFLMQPCDVGLNLPLKNVFKRKVTDFMVTHYQPLTRKDFPGVFKATWDEVKQGGIAMAENTFRICGLYPVNAEAIDYERLLTERPKRY